MTDDPKKKDPVLDGMLERKSFTSVAREIAAGVVAYDKAQKRGPKVKGPEIENLDAFSDEPLRPREMGIPMRTQPNSPREKDLQDAARTREELGLLPKPARAAEPAPAPARSSDSERRAQPTVVTIPKVGPSPRALAVGGGVVVGAVLLALATRAFAPSTGTTPSATAATSAAPVVHAPAAPSLPALPSPTFVSTQPTVASAEPPSASARPHPSATVGAVPAAAASAPSSPAPIAAPPKPSASTMPAVAPPPPATSSGRLPFVPAPE